MMSLTKWAPLKLTAIVALPLWTPAIVERDHTTNRRPSKLRQNLLERFGRAVQQSALDDGRWHGHRTFVVDGSGCSMPDTPALQQAFGQPSEQRPGCGFPVARLLGLF